MLKIFTYSLKDLSRSRWIFFYGIFYLVFTFGLFMLSNDLSKTIISLMNITMVLVPLIATIFSSMYFYNSREFIELLLAQPLPRSKIFIGLFLGVSISLSLCFLIGVGAPFLLYGIFTSIEIWNYSTLLVTGVILSIVFSGISIWISIVNENKLMGFGISIILWLTFSVLYDGVILLLLLAYSEYPIDKFAIGASIFNPISLSRILIMLKLDISALMGFTGAVFKKFFGTYAGMGISFFALIFWIFIPILGIFYSSRKKDF
jgi:Cu-processing system permease protein